MPYLIYLVEDEPNLNEVLRSYLEREGWTVRTFLNGEEAMAAAADGESPHLWILDIMLPGVDGYQMIKEIKSGSPELPVVFISARDAELDRVIGLELGSEDYLAKPFSPRELVIRVRRLLDRLYRADREEDKNVLHVLPYSIYQEQRLVKLEGKEIDLTSKEFEVVLYFARHPGQSFSRDQIIAGVWGSDYFGTDRVVDDMIRRIRRKLPELRLETIYGYGYRLVKS